ncbi:amino acid transporter [Anaeramoeba flamelloides]|uniref:Amino acid transporter n=1 Tax=Anaeramoeba flamelloides TaxID=1746091 RepID=A0ABQ8YIW6_9EUKA|nr:amino acid transporter [Anaeramoeba flamelloides]
MSETKLSEKRPLLNSTNESTKNKPEDNPQILKRISVQTSSILGIGTVSVAFVLKAGGLILGLLILIVSAMLSQYTLRLLARCAKIYRIQTYGDLASLTFGKKGKRFTTFIIFLLCMGSQIGYIRFLGDSLPDLVSSYAGNGLSKDSIWRDEKWLVTFASLVIIYPLCLVKQITKLSFTSALGVSAATWTMVATVIEGCRHFSKDSFDAHEIKYFHFSIEIFLALPIATFAFICHTALFPVLKGLKQPIEKRSNIITGSAIGISFTVYSIISLFGYFIFFNKTDGDLLNSFSKSSGIANSARIAMSITMCFISPVFFFVTRDAYVETFMPKTQELKGWKFFVISTVLFAITLIGSLYVPNIVVAFDLTSAIAGSLVMFSLPALFYLKLRYIEVKFPDFASYKSGNKMNLKQIDSRDSESDSEKILEVSEIDSIIKDEDDKNMKKDTNENEYTKILNALSKQLKKKNFHKFTVDFMKFSKPFLVPVLVFIFGIVTGVVCTIATIISIVENKN